MATGDVVFSKDMDDNKSDIWDDTALVQAYDEAVSSMKAQIARQTGEQPDAANVTAPDKKKHKKKRKQKKNKAKNARQTPAMGSVCQDGSWKVGDRCRAVYSEDSQIYEAVIIDIDNEEETCQVRYRYYGNEEEHYLDDLLMPRDNTSTGTKSISQPPSECDSMDVASVGNAYAGPRSTTPTSYRRGSVGRGMGRGSSMPPPMPPPFPEMSSFSPASFMPPMMPPLFPPTMGGPTMMGSGMPPMPGSMPSMGHSSKGVPDMMPAPPMFDDVGHAENDKEALHSMLLSWYMSGYHTGYYQALKQGKKSAAGKGSHSAKPDPPGTQPEDR